MGLIDIPNTFSASTTAKSAEVNDNFTTIANEFNGNIAAANLATNAVTTAKISDSNVTTAKIADSNVTTAKIADNAVTAAKTDVLPLATDRQNITSNATVTDPHIQYGWTYVQGDGTNSREAVTITFPTAYDSAPVVLASSLGYKTGSNPSTVGDTSSVASGLGDIGWLVSVHTVTTTTCVIEINRTTGTAIPASTRLGLTWVAIGPKAR